MIINVDVLEARLEFYNVVGMDIVNTNICEQLDADFGEEVFGKNPSWHGIRNEVFRNMLTHS